jgi:Kdo2-lipid IVA lauroyltransferase/acyltransferase
MARLTHRLEYVLARAVQMAAQPLSMAAADRVGAGLGRVMYHVLGSRRRIAADNIRCTIGERWEAGEVEELVRRVFANLGRTLLETARLGRYRPERIGDLVAGAGGEHLRRAHERGKGAVLAVAHYGNWELAGSWGLSLGYQIDYLTGIQHNPLVDDLIQRARGQLGVGLIPYRGGLRGVLKALKNNHFVAFACDQHAPRNAIVIEFLGRKAAVAIGPAQFAIRADSPILPFGFRRERYDRHIITAGEPVYPPHSGDEKADIRQMTLAYSRFFEQQIRAYPDQWMWTHRRWKLGE